ncbi:MAG: Rossmann-like and DUF2520 domain-containing protein [Ilumatobacteraceae bacterium]
MLAATDGSPVLLHLRCAVVGDGRLGRALVGSLPWLEGPFRRGFTGADFDLVLLAVPDGEIVSAATAIRPGPMVGHCAGSLGLDVLAPHEAFGLHPLMTVTRAGADFAGAGAAIAGSTPRALSAARAVANALGLQPVEIADNDRAAYHAAASIASNFLVTLEDAAEVMLRTVGADRSALVPLVRATLANWASLGATDALTGPIARGDEATVARQRAAIVERAPELALLFDALCERTRAIAARAGDGDGHGAH